MTDREKLIEILSVPIYPHEQADPTEVVADYLLDNRVIVLPCNIGDKIYYIDRHTRKIEEDTVKYLTVTKQGIKPILMRHNTRFWDYYEWGVSVFLVREEAETALAERKANERKAD